ncbi:hypothetical protein I302_102465 [Kwoniella bestiolae CBS 10118]|uniref:Uncharacterized protein n=1 Tax=Kwoniella bestiolae CBS 10118 TaxID=1296100 RepID=A0A1B9GFA1_9TREE|nr:hypothetical protein I302_01155 [Kwoniella bestiolae CBS 10118]OCF29645.1 hypothetical protein I302_01155 [Kwoniella bestiolae CBS 10118]
MSKLNILNLFWILLIVFFLASIPMAEAWNPYLACKATCNAGYLSCMSVYGNVQICNVALRSCFARCL